MTIYVYFDGVSSDGGGVQRASFETSPREKDWFENGIRVNIIGSYDDSNAIIQAYEILKNEKIITMALGDVVLTNTGAKFLFDRDNEICRKTYKKRWWEA